MTPLLILKSLLGLCKELAELQKHEVDEEALFIRLMELLSDENIELLILSEDREYNHHIVTTANICCNRLSRPNRQIILWQLLKLVGSDNQTLELINSNSETRDEDSRSFWDKYRGFIMITIICLIFTIFAYREANKSTQINDNIPVNGDLNTTFLETESQPELTEEQKFQQNRQQLISEGWEEPQIDNGQLPVCYNFTPKKSAIDNYLEVYVGSGTDVAIKVMNIKNDNCVRYVFINSRSTYRIKNIPEGRYYLKIAYGKNWFSKIENSQCIGKFARNPIYEKGEEIMDFNLKEREDSYSIPSFKLSLDIIASDVSNTFESKNISEIEFNQ